jgi:hypothetical protein
MISKKSMRTWRSGRTPWLTLIYLVDIVLLPQVLRQLYDALFPLRESRPQRPQLRGNGSCRYKLADTIDVGPVHLHGASSGSNSGGSSTWWEKNGRLCERQDRVMVAKKCRAFKT